MSGSLLVSVVIPLYNREGYIGETIASLQSQSYADWEAIVVDDGSTDNSKAVVSQMAASDNRIKLLTRERQPKGANVCRNIGLEKAAGDYIIFLDSDDLLKPFCIEQRVAKCKEFPHLDLLVFHMLWFNEHPGDLDVLQNIPTTENDLDRFLRRDMVWLIHSPIWKRSSLQSIGGFDEEISCFQESELHTRALILGLKYKFFENEQPDCYYRRESGSTISSKRFSDPLYFHSQLHIIHNFIKLLNEKNMMTEARKKILASVLLKISSWWFGLPALSKEQKRLEADRTWQLAFDNHLVDSKVLTLGKLYVKLRFSLVLSNLPLLRKIVEKRFTDKLLKDYFKLYPDHRGKYSFNKTSATGYALNTNQ